MKKFLSFVLAFAVLLSVLVFSSCNDNVQTIQREDNGEEVPLSNLTQVATKKKDFLDTLVSWYDDEYNYYVYQIGEIKNIPLTSTYTVFYYDGNANASMTKSVVKATEESVSYTTSKAVTKSVHSEITDEYNIQLGVGAGKEGVFYAGVQSGYSQTVTNGVGSETTWSDSYSSCITVAGEETDTISLNFDSSCKKGNYLYLLLGNVTVYYVVIQPKNDLETYYIETYNEVYASKYALVYTGNDDSFPINDKAKIEIDTSFISDLKAPSKYIESAPPQDVEKEVITQTRYWDDSLTVPTLDTYAWWIAIDELDDYYAQGYNKIDIEYKFYTTGGWSLFGGNVNIDCYISSSKNTSDHVHSQSVASSTSGKWVEGSEKTDLHWFTSSNQIYLILSNGNITEEFTVSKLTFTVKIYRE